MNKLEAFSSARAIRAAVFRLFWISVLVLCHLLAAGMAAAGKPNVVLILADDIGIDGIGCYGGTSYQTPQLDKMAAEGIRFTHAYSQPLCTPTRVQIMTGKYNHRNWHSFGILDPKERTFGHLMKEAGYKTCIAGKWQLQSYDPPDFPNAERRRGLGMKVTEAGFDEHSLFHSWHTEDKGSRYANPTLYENGKLYKDLKDRYGPDNDVEFILDFMKRFKNDPMFIYYPMALPHWPMVPTPDSKVWGDSSRRLEESTDYFPDMVAYMDKVVGEIVDGIATLGLSENTLVIFYSDNGTDRRITSRFQGQDIVGGKATPAQTGIRVPLIAYWPGTIQPGQEISDLIDASDFLPTLAELADVSIPQDWGHEGVSFAPQLLGREGDRREWCFFWYDPRPGWDKEKYRRHIFALDHRYKLFSDGRFYDIAGEGLREVKLDTAQLDDAGREAQRKLQQVIEMKMKPPLSESAKVEVDAFGNPLQ